MNTEFKLYHENDYKDLQQMIFSLYNEDPEGEPINEYKINQTIQEFQKNPYKINIYLFKNNNKNIGYAILVFFWSNEYGGNLLTIDELYILEKYRNKGVATEFMSFIENIENIVALQIETTPSNRRSFEYYKRLGYKSNQNSHLIKMLC